MLEPWAKLQAMLQGILQGVGPVGCCYKVLTGRVVEREFRACGPRFWAFPGCLFLDPRSWSGRPRSGRQLLVLGASRELSVLKVFRVGGPRGDEELRIYFLKLARRGQLIVLLMLSEPGMGRVAI